MTGPLTWLAHALLDTLQARGDQGAGLLGKAAVSLLGQLPEAGAGPRAGSDLHADWHFFKAVSETEVVTDGILPAFRSRPEKGEMLSVDREEWSGRAQFLGERPCLETPVLPQGPGAPAPLSRGENGKLASKTSSLLTEHVAKPDLVCCLSKPSSFKPSLLLAFPGSFSSFPLRAQD